MLRANGKRETKSFPTAWPSREFWPKSGTFGKTETDLQDPGSLVAINHVLLEGYS